eukprot:3973450-Amphidinium_carterae.1
MPLSLDSSSSHTAFTQAKQPEVKSRLSQAAKEAVIQHHTAEFIGTGTLEMEMSSDDSIRAGMVAQPGHQAHACEWPTLPSRSCLRSSIPTE